LQRDCRGGESEKAKITLRCNFGGHEFGKGSILAGILSRGGKNCYDSYAMMGYVYVLYIMYSFFDT
jgi:hypothetical protein